MELKYKNLMDFTDEDIIFIMGEIFPYLKVTKIERIDTEGSEEIRVSIFSPIIDNDYEFNSIELTDEELVTSGIYSSYEHQEQWLQYIAASGCIKSLRNNPYIGNPRAVIHKKNTRLKVFIYDVEIGKPYAEAQTRIQVADVGSRQEFYMYEEQNPLENRRPHPAWDYLIPCYCLDEYEVDEDE